MNVTAATKRLNKTRQKDFNTVEAAQITGLDRYTVLYHLRQGNIATRTKVAKSATHGPVTGYVIPRSALKTFIASRV